ncbi:MAG: sigma-70 factor domain-containing protein, partial [Synechococcaceae cyanobacterium]
MVLALSPTTAFPASEALAPDPGPVAAPAAAPSTNLRQLPAIDGDLVRSYLRDIGRVPLLSHEQEITLGRQVQELMQLEELREELTLRAAGEEP